MAKKCNEEKYRMGRVHEGAGKNIDLCFAIIGLGLECVHSVAILGLEVLFKQVIHTFLVVFLSGRLILYSFQLWLATIFEGIS